MIQLSTLPVTGAIASPRPAGLPGAMTSDFALALAATGGAVPGPLVRLPLAGERHDLAVPGNSLPDDASVLMADPAALPQELLVAAPSIDVKTPRAAVVAAPRPEAAAPIGAEVAIPVAEDEAEESPITEDRPKRSGHPAHLSLPKAVSATPDPVATPAPAIIEVAPTLPKAKIAASDAKIHPPEEQSLTAAAISAPVFAGTPASPAAVEMPEAWVVARTPSQSAAPIVQLKAPVGPASLPIPPAMPLPDNAVPPAQNRVPVVFRPEGPAFVASEGVARPLVVPPAVVQDAVSFRSPLDAAPLPQPVAVQMAVKSVVMQAGVAGAPAPAAPTGLTAVPAETIVVQPARFDGPAPVTVVAARRAPPEAVSPAMPVAAAPLPVTDPAHATPITHEQPVSVASTQPVRQRPDVQAPAIPVRPAGQAFAAALFEAGQRPARDGEGDSAPALADMVASGIAAPAASPTAHIAAPLAHAPVDTTRGEWTGAMIDRIEILQGESGTRDTRIRLTPDALGAVDVQIRHDRDGNVQVSISADTPQARALLAEAAPRLAEMAEARGLKLGQGDASPGAGQQHAQRDARQPAAPVPMRPASASIEDDTRTDTRIA